VLGLVLPWILVPNLVVLIWSWTVRPVYAERYLAFTAPALALLLAYGFAQLSRRRHGQVAVAVVTLGLCLVVQVSQRAEGSKAEDDYRALARFVADRWPEAVLFAVPSARGVAVAYPEAFEGIGLPNVGQDAVESESLWGTVQPPGRLRLREVAERGDRLVLLDAAEPSWPGTPFGRWLVRHDCELEDLEAAERFTAYLVSCP
jgi:mannosyltransferase